MSSQDTMNTAQSEAESARLIQQEIQKNQADIAAMQNDVHSEEMQDDIRSKTQVNDGLQEKYQEHISNEQRLRQQAMDEQRQEQEEQLRQQREADDKSLGQQAREGIINNLF